MEKFSERLKELRQERGLSIQGLAKEVQISSSALCRWENCQADIRGSQLVILAKYFGVTIDFLMGLEFVFVEIFYSLFFSAENTINRTVKIFSKRNQAVGFG